MSRIDGEGRSRHSAFQVLDLSDCDIGGVGAKAIAELVRTNYAIRFLGVSFDCLGGMSLVFFFDNSIIISS